YMHNLRGFAIVLVIVAHSISALSTANDIALLRSALTNATVLFVVISGYFFSLLESRYSYYSYLVNKFKNVVFPYLF
ncbi:acyltransferase family protein, partial [Pseudoalteromonas sp. CAL494-MNA-CIBAN-0108]